MRWIYDDGGRASAGYSGKAGDCVARAIAIATGRPYGDVYETLNDFAAEERPQSGRKRSSARSGVFRRSYDKLLTDMGWTWHPTMGIGTGCRVHLRGEELPGGRVIASCSRHMVAVIDGVIRDTHDPSRGGTRCVYGYWTPPR